MKFNIELLKSNRFISNVEIFDTVDSTSTYIKNNDFNDGYLVVSREQTSGRGQNDRTFLSKKNQGIYFSYLKEDIPPSKLHLITVIVACACVETLGNDVQIKWVNDLMKNGFKIGGILCESLHLGKKSKTIIGIGINTAVVDKSISNIATHVEINNCSTFINNLIVKINKFLGYDNEHIIEVYKNRLCHVNQYIRIQGEDLEYKCVDIDIDGSLIVMNSEKKERKLRTERIIIDNIEK